MPATPRGNGLLGLAGNPKKRYLYATDAAS
jgi:hypothetical protein